MIIGGAFSMLAGLGRVWVGSSIPIRSPAPIRFPSSEMAGRDLRQSTPETTHGQ